MVHLIVAEAHAMQKNVLRSVVMAVSIFSVKPSLAADQVPSCDTFRERFVDAQRALTVRLPSLRLNREPQDQIHKEDIWTTDRTRAADSGEKWYGTELHCRADKFFFVTTEIDAPTGSLHPSFDLVAANIYAYTGWGVDKVIRIAGEVLKSRSRDMGDIKATELSPGAYAKIAYMSFVIEGDD
jgi:hypothetical protein